MVDDEHPCAALDGAPVSTPAVYRFLPFTRRGLVAELRDSAAGAEGDLPQRASIKLDVTLSDGLGGASTTTPLAGPGDVVGLDPRAIVRLTPRGRETFEAMAKQHEQWIVELFAGMDASAMQRLYKHLGELRVRLVRQEAERSGGS